MDEEALKQILKNQSVIMAILAENEVVQQAALRTCQVQTKSMINKLGGKTNG